MRIRHLGAISIAPLLSVGLLVGLAAQSSSHIKPADVEPFHQLAKKEIAAYPYYVGSWVGRDEEVPPAAVQLLRPNIIISRQYTNTATSGIAPHGSFQLLIVQCRDSRDMVGHYPPVCYPAHGQTMQSETAREWDVDGFHVKGMEYLFSYRTPERGILKRVVYNFMIIPGRGFARDLHTLESAAEDYQERYYGAAQFQLVFPDAIDRDERDAILKMMLGARPQMLKALLSGGVHEK